MRMKTLLEGVKALLITLLVVGFHAAAVYALLESPPEIQPPAPAAPLMVSLITPAPVAAPSPAPPVEQAPPVAEAPPVEPEPEPENKPEPEPEIKPEPKPEPKPKPKPKPVSKPKLKPKPQTPPPEIPPQAPPAESPPQAAPPSEAKPAAQAVAAPALPETAPIFSAAYLNNPRPAYPRLAKRRGETGTVYLRVQVNAAGSPAQVRLHRSSGSADLDEAAQDAVRGWRFVPAKRGDLPVIAWVIVPIEFRLQ
jgi:protein TonB